MWQPVMTIGSGCRYRCFFAVSFPTRMTRRSPKKSNRSKGAFFELSPELKSQRRQITEFLDKTAGKPPVLPEGCNFQITWLEPSVMRELQIRERKAKQRLGVLRNPQQQ
ncbi:hypothetical protein SynA1840_02114 [Synechococcus sp. A18-40]|nr:hypothetical protein SynA1840_02114 [Synechococcus sp. A18-40]